LKRKDKNGRPKFIDPEEEERKRQHKAMNKACYERTMEKYRRLEEEEQLRATSDELRASDNEQPAFSLRRAVGYKSCSVVLRGVGGKRRSVRKCRRPMYFIAEAALLYPVFSG
ncbi:MAG: hypothetical protein J7621_30435, partial [Niastella sp.]|nr:hypothetical protein [Niastella sp.]